MLDVGWSELLLIGVVALVVIGPEDLPKLFHTLGRITAKARGMAREFSMAMEDAAKGTGITEATKELRDLKAMTSKKAMGLDALDRAATRFEQWDPKSSLERTLRARPDPAAPEVSAAPHPNAGQAADVATSHPATGSVPGQASEYPSGPVTGVAPGLSSAADQGSVSSSGAGPAHSKTGDSASDTPTPGRRRIAGVRRSDTKDR